MTFIVCDLLSKHYTTVPLAVFRQCGPKQGLNRCLAHKLITGSQSRLQYQFNTNSYPQNVVTTGLGFCGLEQLILDARQKLQEAEERAEDACQKRQEAEEQAEDARRERQEAEERAEQERQRAEDARQKRQEAEERAEQERQRAEDARRKRQEAESAEGNKTRPTTFKEYIRACHIFLSKPLRTQTDKRLGTQGSITNPNDKPCPTFLKPWKDFPTLQQQLFKKVNEYIPSKEEYFSSTLYLKELGPELCDRPFASKKDLEIYQRFAVEQPTTKIISYLQRIEEARRAFNLGEDIVFENPVNSLSDSNDEVQESLQNLRSLSKGPASSSNRKPRHADQICVYKDANGTRSLCMVVEYKSSHRLSVFNLRAGLLRADRGYINVSKDVINQLTIPTEPKEKFVYHSEWLTIAALTQTYACMIENGLEYSKLATGQADVFLRVTEDEPHTLYYHLAEPNIEAEAQSEASILLCRTAVGQTLTFCLLALDSKPRSQKWRNQALETAYRAVIDYQLILRRIPAKEKNLTPPSVFHARIYPVQRSPIISRPRRSRKARNTYGSADMNVHEDRQNLSSSSDETSDVETPSKPRARTRQSGTGQVRPVKSPKTAEESDIHHRQYCTQACLLGLVRKHPLDDACPNINGHRVYAAGNHHALGRKSLAKLMLRQLTENPDNGCKPLGKQGARGALFRLTLESYGYTFVAKGTVTAFTANLEHEGLIYRHLDEVQGELIPVYLGNISLIRPYFLDLGVRIVHMLLMSWAGERARNDLMLAMGRDLATETSRAATKMLDCGVEHRDVRPANVLWNPEIRNVVLVDFERSKILKQVLASRDVA